jgi:hypothetical protein
MIKQGDKGLRGGKINLTNKEIDDFIEKIKLLNWAEEEKNYAIDLLIQAKK